MECRMSAKSQNEFAAICKKNKWKCTVQRLAVYDFVHDNHSHPDVDMVWSHIRRTAPTVTRESTYRILNELADNGILNRLDHIERARYDSHIEPHGHFICEKCGRILDFQLPQDLNVVPFVPGCEVRQTELRVTGICDGCRLSDGTSYPQKGVF